MGVELCEISPKNDPQQSRQSTPNLVAIFFRRTWWNSWSPSWVVTSNVYILQAMIRLAHQRFGLFWFGWWGFVEDLCTTRWMGTIFEYLTQLGVQWQETDMVMRSWWLISRQNMAGFVVPYHHDEFWCDMLGGSNTMTWNYPMPYRCNALWQVSIYTRSQVRQPAIISLVNFAHIEVPIGQDARLEDWAGRW